MTSSLMSRADLMPEAPSGWVAPGWVAETYNLALGTVHAAIRSGKLPATAVPTARGRFVYVISPAAAFEAWGARYVAAQLAAATDDA